jgi:hypothetical protein
LSLFVRVAPGDEGREREAAVADDAVATPAAADVDVSVAVLAGVTSGNALREGAEEGRPGDEG